jgi:hypothetical protein
VLESLLAPKQLSRGSLVLLPFATMHNEAEHSNWRMDCLVAEGGVGHGGSLTPTLPRDHRYAFDFVAVVYLPPSWLATVLWSGIVRFNRRPIRLTSL